jgi:hypothetical protein
MSCPKCGSNNISVTRERSGYGPAKGEPVAACTCGKRLYGKQVEAEFELQYVAWQTEQQKKPPEPTPQPTTARNDNQAWVARYRELAKDTLVALEGEVRQAISHRDRVDKLWISLGIPYKDDEAGRQRNLLNLEVVTVERLGREALHTARALDLAARGDLAQKQFQILVSKAKDIHTHLARVPAYADRACDAARGEASRPAPPPLVLVTTCARPECEIEAVEGRKYCGDDCRKRVAREAYTARKRSGNPPTRLVRPVVVPPEPTPVVVNGYAAMGRDELLKTNLQLLRKYARNELKIIGASKIRGGKTALVSRIIEVRGQ